jgi:hypothetical protein
MSSGVDGWFVRADAYEPHSEEAKLSSQIAIVSVDDANRDIDNERHSRKHPNLAY